MAFFRNIWKNSTRHQKLSEELALQNAKEVEAEEPDVIENENDVITFKLKYLGSTVVEKIIGDNINTESVKNIIKAAKASRKKLQRVNLAISLKGIAVTDLPGNDLLKISIYRISNCATDASHRQVFSFVSTDANETMECHAFICSKRKMAETVTLAVAHAFSTAYHAWRIRPATKEFEKSLMRSKENEKNTINAECKIEKNIIEEKLIDFDDDPIEGQIFGFSGSEETSNWVCFDDDFASDNRMPFKKDLIMA